MRYKCILSFGRLLCSFIVKDVFSYVLHNKSSTLKLFCKHSFSLNLNTYVIAGFFDEIQFAFKARFINT